MRLIDADVLKTKAISCETSELYDSPVFFKAVCTKEIDEAPTIDAVEVVRCRDCKHRYSDSWCEYVDDDDNFYCARGERKDGAD